MAYATGESGVALVRIGGRVYRQARVDMDRLRALAEECREEERNEEAEEEEDGAADWGSGGGTPASAAAVAPCPRPSPPRATAASAAAASPTPAAAQGDSARTSAALGAAAAAPAAPARESRRGAECERVLEIPSKVHGFLIGKGGKNLQSLKQSTGARVVFPKKDSGSNIVRVLGRTEDIVESAATQLSIMLESAAAHLPFTHFVCLPLTALDSATLERLRRFHATVLRLGVAGLEESMLVPPATLHLTLLMLKLLSAADVARAADTLQASADAIRRELGGQPLTITLDGLQYMNDDPSKVDVLYFKTTEGDGGADASGPALRIASVVRRAFGDAGFLRDTREVKLHATCINTKHSSTPGRRAINVGPVMERFARERLGAVAVPAVLLVERGAFGSDGFWKVVSSVPLLCL